MSTETSRTATEASRHRIRRITGGLSKQPNETLLLSSFSLRFVNCLASAYNFCRLQRQMTATVAMADYMTSTTQKRLSWTPARRSADNKRVRGLDRVLDRFKSKLKLYLKITLINHDVQSYNSKISGNSISNNGRNRQRRRRLNRKDQTMTRQSAPQQPTCWPPSHLYIVIAHAA